MRWGAPVLVAAALCGCSAEPDPVAPVAGPITLDCGQGFEALARAITERPGIRPAPIEPSEPYLAFTEADSSASYILTRDGAPAHPAILRQVRVSDGQGRRMVHDGCAFGDPAAFEAVKTYWDTVAAAR